jgi:hypothetical protein
VRVTTKSSSAAVQSRSPSDFEVGSNATPGLAGFISIKALGAGDFELYIYKPNAPGNHLEDDQFALVTP